MKKHISSLRILFVVVYALVCVTMFTAEKSTSINSRRSMESDVSLVLNLESLKKTTVKGAP